MLNLVRRPERLAPGAVRVRLLENTLHLVEGEAEHVAGGL